MQPPAIVILLVSPDIAFAHACADRLASARHRTVTAGSTDEALAQATRRRFDLVLVDAELADERLFDALGHTPTIVLLNRKSLDEVMDTADAIAPEDAPLARRA